jgi:uncharacterized protein (TIRG00374 family)
MTGSSSRLSRSIAGPVLGGIAALALFGAVLAVARPAEVWRLLQSTDGGFLALALGISAAFLAARGLRLLLLLDHRGFGWFRATLVAAAAQAAALFAPFRTGELVLPWLLARTLRRDMSSGVGILLAARALDLASLGMWCGFAVLVVWGLTEPLALCLSVFILGSSLLLPVTLAVVDRVAVRTLAPRGMVGRRWARRVRRVRREVDRLVKNPLRLGAAVFVSVVMWGLQWGVAWALLAGMGHRWPPVEVAAGASIAAVANLLPLNLIANLGTLEAGWTAAFTALGIPLQTAAATGLAAHIWGLVFAAFYGALAWGILSSGEKEHPS